MRSYEAIVMGASAGGLKALCAILPELPGDFSLPVMIVQHTAPDANGYLAVHLDRLSRIRVKEAIDKETIQPATATIAPPGYHLLVESGRILSLSLDDPVHYARPSIDVLFETAADVYGDQLIGVILTGANSDGSQGLNRIKQQGGLIIVQDPSTAESPFMPTAAIEAVEPDYILRLEEIGPLLRTFHCQGEPEPVPRESRRKSQ